MGIIKPYLKYDLNLNKWKYKINDNELGRCFSIARYKRIINNPTEKINYIILAPGSRVEDYSKDRKIISDKEVRVDYVIKHFRNLKQNFCIELFLMDTDAPIREDSKMLARYIDKIASIPNTESINILGLSKCGVMSFYIPSYFKTLEAYKKTNIFNIATPYNGTKLASPLIVYPEIKKVISDKLGNRVLSDLVFKAVIKYYEQIGSNSHMDYDIAIKNGIPESKKKYYDSSFISEVFSEKNVEAIKQINSFNNFITGIDENTMKEAFLTGNFTGMGLCLLDDLFFNNESDGMVYSKSQEKVEKYLDIKSIKLISSHHYVNSNLRVMNKILSKVDETIDEQKEKAKVKIKEI